MIDRTATARIQRLMRWLEPFQRCFGHRAQRLALRTYVQGVFSDSDRKSMQAMLARVTEPVSYQAFQHFITHAPWDADRIWRRLLEILPERRGVLIIDGTSFPKQGPHSVGVARQYCGALGKIANCQVAVTAALWTGTRAWLLGALLYLPQSWSEDANRRAATRIPSMVSFQEKWRQALALIRRARAAGLHLTAVVADAEFGDITAFRRLLHQWRLPYALGVSRQLTVFRGTPAVHIPPSSRTGRPRSQLVLVHDTRPITVRAVALALPARAWRRVTWRNGTNRPWAARFAAVRVTPANEWRNRRLAPEVWLLCEQDLGLTPRIKYFFVHLPATASLKQLVRLAHQRWAIEQQYQELKTELGLDHFEGRSYPGWHRHVALTAVAYAFLQRERMRPDADPALTLPAVRAIVTETFTALLFAQKPSYLKRLQELQNIQLRI
ncbi:MAG TPA: IS701 family transposase [Vicinamibacterales bacterium]|nr:IS701 family transposase [Vicinamibacterales bacterium]